MIVSRHYTLAGLALAFALLGAAVARPLAQEQSGGAMQGIALNRDQPVKIVAESLEVRDKIRQATFMGDVKLTQGDTTLKCNTLVVFYEDSASTGSKGGAQAQKSGSGASNQQIKRAEAKGNVFVTQKDQTASGDNGVYDAKSNTITMTGNVVVTQSGNVMRGERMEVNLATGITKVFASKGKQIEMMTQPGAKDAAAPAVPPAAKGPPAAKDAKAAPTAPSGARTPGPQSLGPPARIN